MAQLFIRMNSEKSLFFGFRSLCWLGKPYYPEDRLSWWQAVCSISVITLITTVSILFSLQGSFQHERISSTVSFFGIVANNFLASNLILLNLRRNHPLGPVMKVLYSLPFSQPASNHIVWMLFGFSLVLTNLCLDFFAFPVHMLVQLIPVYYLSDVLIYLFLAQFVIPLLMIRDQFTNISLSLKCLGRREPPDLLYQTTNLLGVHRELIDLCSQLNQIFSLPLLVIVGAKLFGATGSMYYCVCSYFHLLGGSSPRVGSYAFLISAAHEIYQIWCIIHTAWMIVEKVRKVNGDFYSLCLNEKSNSLIENELITSFLEQRVTLTFTARGLFRLDHSLFQSILATTTTYLFIIIQFQIRSNFEEMKNVKLQN